MKQSRDEKIEALVQCWSDAIELDDLIVFFQDTQREYLRNVSDQDLNDLYDSDVQNKHGMEQTE